MTRQTIVTVIAAVIAGTFVLAAAAQQTGDRAPFWPRLKGDALFSEWYSDIPWHQKLGTFAGNQIDQALVLPFEVLGQTEKDLCAKLGYNQEQCMIEIGVTNILGTLRTDTLYDPLDPKIKLATQNCGDIKLPCVEVKLELSRWWAQPTGKSLPERPIDLTPQIFGVEEPFVEDYPSGYVITDGSTYAPQMPWYMSHYCDSKFPDGLDGQDPVCYADYLSPMNVGFNLQNGNFATWPAAGPWSVFPYAPFPPANINHCKQGLKTCTLTMAAFDLAPVPPSVNDLQYQKYNAFLLGWFNRAMTRFPTDVTPAELQRHYPWTGATKTWEAFVYQQALFNPFLGKYAPTTPAPGTANPPGCDVTFDGPVVGSPPVTGKCYNTIKEIAKTNLYPRQCTLHDLAGAAAADLDRVSRLRRCSLNFELHHNGFVAQWPVEYRADFAAAAMKGNQYGRTSFLFAGVPGMQLPASFLKDATSDSGMSIYEQVYNASIFSMYLPVANVADFKNAMDGRNYTEDFYHTLLMSNHNEADPQTFADGIRGKVLWHNEYRMRGMYEAYEQNPGAREVFRPRMFAASFDAPKAPSPFHGNTCDSCHVRNGSGIPINTEGKLDKVLQEFMTDGVYATPLKDKKDYTFTGVIRPMKLVFLDLRKNVRGSDANTHSEPLAFPETVLEGGGGRNPRDDLYYSNKIMNYWGNSFHVTTPGNNYTWTYMDATLDRLVVADERSNPELVDPQSGKHKVYKPQQIKLDAFQTSSTCELVRPPPRRTQWPGKCNEVNGAATSPTCELARGAPPSSQWPSKCSEVNGAAITAAIAAGEIGYMHLNGKRLGNLSAIEAIPNKAIIGFRDSQKTSLGPDIGGEILWNAGSRDGYLGSDGKGKGVKLNCVTKSLSDCYIGRFGWVGDRVSLEDQVANAAFVEMNLMTSEGYEKLYPKGDAMFPIRYDHPNCGPANKTCIDSKGNGNLSERDIERMADYARWVGNPTRSELKVALPEVIAGEKVFNKLGCNTCHVNAKIEIVPEDTMTNKEFRARLATRVKAASGDGPKAAPFLSYIGTDLLMHDMGYLSQVAAANQPIRNGAGVVLPGYENYVQKIRTPALKGLGLNRFVTDSYKNTKSFDPAPDKFKLDAACDFLLHDGRACDAIEAAFLHDGPAIKKLDTIGKLNRLSAREILELRAFLYSL